MGKFFISLDILNRVMTKIFPLNHQEILLLKSIVQLEKETSKGSSKSSIVNNFVNNYSQEYINLSQRTRPTNNKNTIRKRTYDLLTAIENAQLLLFDPKNNQFGINKQVFSLYFNNRVRNSTDARFYQNALNLIERYLTNKDNRLTYATKQSKLFKMKKKSSRRFLSMSDEELTKEFDTYLAELKDAFEKDKQFTLYVIADNINYLSKIKKK